MFKTQLLAIPVLGLIVMSCSPSYAGQFANNHPRREQVLDRNQRTNGRLNAEEGTLSGHYKQLKAQNQSIHRQERRDARANGGHISIGEQHQLNREHNQLNRQIRHDRQ